MSVLRRNEKLILVTGSAVAALLLLWITSRQILPLFWKKNIPCSWNNSNPKERKEKTILVIWWWGDSVHSQIPTKSAKKPLRSGYICSSHKSEITRLRRKRIYLEFLRWKVINIDTIYTFHTCMGVRRNQRIR